MFTKMGWKVVATLLLFLSISWILSSMTQPDAQAQMQAWAQAQAQTPKIAQRLNLTADATVNATMPDTPNNSASLGVQGQNLGGTCNSSIESYLKVDLSSLSGSINSASLSLRSTFASSGNMTMSLFGSTEDSWDEATVTWNTKPALDSTTLVTATITAAGSDLLFSSSAALVAFLETQRTADGVATLGIVATACDAASITQAMDSKEGTVPPQLDVQSALTPTPSATNTPSPTNTPGTPTVTSTPTLTNTPTVTGSVTPTATGSVTPTDSVTPMATGSVTPTGTPTATATPSGIISNVTISKLRDTTFTVSWTTDQETNGQVRYGTDPSNLNNTAEDNRGAETNDDTHYVTILELTPETTYYFDVVSRGTTDNNGGTHYSVTTGPIIALPGSDTIYGQVFQADGTTPAEGAIVRLTLRDNDGMGSKGDAALLTALVDASGFWNANLGSARTVDLSAYFTYSASGDQVVIEAQGAADGNASQSVDTNNDTQAPDMLLPSTSTATPTATATATATATPTATATTTPTEADSVHQLYLPLVIK